MENLARIGARLLGSLTLALGLFTWVGGPGPAASLAFADDPEQQVVVLVNDERAKRGLPPLIVASELTSSARAYAREMATQDFFAHVAPDGSTLVSRDEAAGYRNWSYLEENLAAGQPTPNQAVVAWMASPAHREDILSPNVRETGVGLFVQPGSPYVYYWVQEFGRRPDVQPVAYVAPFRPPPVASPWIASTGHVVSGAWLGYVSAHGGVDAVGLPRTNVIVDPLTGQQVQYFQRAVLEWHPENPPGQQIQRRLLGDLLYPGADPGVSPDDAPPGPSTYFPDSPGAPTGLGHFVADYTRSGQPIYFKQFFDQHGGAAAFGYPKEEPKLRDGMWTQRFQAAVLQYHPEDNHPGLEAYRVQAELLGDEYIQMKGLPYR